MDLSNFMRGGRIGPQVLGHRGGRLVVDMSHVPLEHDAATGLDVMPLDAVFCNPAEPILVFGKPNVSLVLPGHRERFAAFMFFRNRSAIVPTKGRVQAGVLAQLAGLPKDAHNALAMAAKEMTGKLGPSCAFSNARVLHQAGFRLGNGKSLRWIIRPSRLAALIWQYGLRYQGQPVDVHFIQTRATVSDHFVSVWTREYSSLVRLVQKYVTRSHKSSAPVFSPRGESVGMDDSAWRHSTVTTIGISRPSALGVNLGYILGEQPFFTCRLPAFRSEELRAPLAPFPGKLDRMTKLKKYVLFSKPVIAFLQRNLEARTDWFQSIPTHAVVEMLRLSPGPDRAGAFVYNYVLTSHAFRIKRLLNGSGRDSRFVNWMLAKHVLISRYNPNVRLAGELWCYRDNNGELTVCLNAESGTYKPDDSRLLAAVKELEKFFGVKVIAQTRH